jgi:hypothetical protein
MLALFLLKIRFKLQVTRRVDAAIHDLIEAWILELELLEKAERLRFWLFVIAAGCLSLD